MKESSDMFPLEGWTVLCQLGIVDYSYSGNDESEKNSKHRGDGKTEIDMEPNQAVRQLSRWLNGSNKPPGSEPSSYKSTHTLVIRTSIILESHIPNSPVLLFPWGQLQPKWWHMVSPYCVLTERRHNGKSELDFLWRLDRPSTMMMSD